MSNETKSAEILLSLKEQFKQSKRNIEILNIDSSKINTVKVKWNIPDDTLWGAILYNTGGIVFDGWVRLLASGERDIVNWNATLNINGFIVVADDILGGLFGLNTETNIIHYFAPDTLEWEDMEVTYSQFVRWLAEGDVDRFYDAFRWDNWEEEVSRLKMSEGISFYPFLWAKPEQERHKKVIPLEEIVLLSFDMKQQLGF